MLHAFIDDSASSIGDKRLVLAAYVHSAEDWQAFSDEWEAALEREPRIDYFKMVEAKNRRDQFKGWSESKRNQKVFALAKVIEDFGPLSIDCSLSLKAHKEVLQPYAPYGLGSPYFPLVFALVCGVARACHMLGASFPCDFVFDKQDNVSKHVLLFWDHIIDQQPLEWGRLIKASPVFRDDKDVLPLQAADMLAWNTRRNYEGSYPAEFDGLIDMIRADRLSYSLDITPEYLEKWAEGMKDVPGAAEVVSKRGWNAAMNGILRNGGLESSTTNGGRNGH